MDYHCIAEIISSCSFFMLWFSLAVAGGIIFEIHRYFFKLTLWEKMDIFACSLIRVFS